MCVVHLLSMEVDVKVVFILLLMVVSFAVSFGVFTFWSWSYDASTWSEDFRLAYLAISSGMSFVSVGYYLETTK